MAADSDSRRLAIVVNPVKVNLRRLRAAVTAEEAQAGWGTSEWFETSAHDDGRSAALAAAASHPDAILVVGGDGTLRVVAESIYETRIPIAVLPVGTGNLFARNLRLPLNDITLGVRTAFSGRDRPVDIAFAELSRDDGTSTTHAFLVMAGVGIDARMAGHTNPKLKKRVGWVAYTDPIARSVFGNRQIDLSYEIDDEPRRTMRAHSVIVGNCGTLTAGILLLPDASVDDGLLDAVAIRPKGGGDWTKIVYRLTFNRLFHRTAFGRLLSVFLPTSRTVRYRQGRRLQIHFDRPEEIQLDGDPFGLVSAVALTLEHKALELRLPGAA
ncbi:diacylglycerol kinase family protein [Frondihabitans sp. PAMC 28766]|uniref:diacylglycerol/lipid kinase family protein n=1 Tax=Frondihabitans sp. PAMC 28766 TaxID=1795630 RepID=UPI000A519C69|nr:diacylglycerol kinase family protein [Frondihabitans sp. PAMC 28766]